jgi:hypothetical protein
MSDETVKRSPPLPELYTIPAQTIERWLSLAPAQFIQLRLSRSDLDAFFQALDRNFAAQFHLSQTLINYSNGRLDEANDSLHEAQRQLAEAQNYFRRFFNGVMAGATPKDEGNA